MADSYYENAHHDDDSVDTNPNGYQSQHQDYHPQDGGHGPQGDLSVADGQYANGAPTPAKSDGAGGMGASGAAQTVKKALSSWVGFSNLPNQVHRKSVR